MKYLAITQVLNASMQKMAIRSGKTTKSDLRKGDANAFIAMIKEH